MILTNEEREVLFDESDLECYSSDDIEAASKFAAATRLAITRAAAAIGKQMREQST